MEERLFEDIREELVSQNPDIAKGKMMSSEAITYQDKVFAFFSKKKKMVFKLGKAFDPDHVDMDIQVFNPFKNRGPLNGWFEVPYSEKEQWRPLAKQALDTLKNES